MESGLLRSIASKVASPTKNIRRKRKKGKERERMARRSKEVKMAFVLNWSCYFGPGDSDSGDEEIYADSEEEGIELVKFRINAIKAEIRKGKDKDPKEFRYSFYKRIKIPE